MGLHKFNKDRALKRLHLRQNKSKYIKVSTLIISIIVLVFFIIYFSFSQFSTSNKFNVIQTKVGDFSKGDVTIAAYLDGNNITTIPDKSSTLKSFIICSNDNTAYWDSTSWNMVFTTLKSLPTKCNIYFITPSSSNTFAYSYTGDVQTFTASQSGYYVIEAWGAQGGYQSTPTYGTGAYTIGILNLVINDKFYIYVGQAGSQTSNASYNGGGSGPSSPTGFSGGGATDFRYFASTPDSSDLVWNSDLGLKSRIIVAAGGGATGGYIDGGQKGYGGALKGFGGAYYAGHGDKSQYGTGGTQISGGNAGNNIFYATGVVQAGSFGNGGNNYSISSALGGGAGGSGYYGGGAGGGTQGNGSGNGGGGGSSYISGYKGCVAISSSTSLTPRNDSSGTQCTETSAASDITCSYHYSGKVFTNTEMIAGNASMPTHDGTSTMTGNSGNGYAKITYLGSSIN
jgi:hypothetical protein